jgi:hypothetical protein
VRQTLELLLSSSATVSASHHEIGPLGQIVAEAWIDIRVPEIILQRILGVSVFRWDDRPVRAIYPPHLDAPPALGLTDMPLVQSRPYSRYFDDEIFSALKSYRRMVRRLPGHHRDPVGNRDERRCPQLHIRDVSIHLG